ncbi:MAG: hypothetical protein Ct9H300mP1_29800 [Planctomycetaceae bacterium]|nr:MAG: hypothetical protein Ct9H300mP1_29800 [Planctomycetaceae bacterium]
MDIDGDEGRPAGGGISAVWIAAHRRRDVLDPLTSADHFVHGRPPRPFAPEDRFGEPEAAVLLAGCHHHGVPRGGGL